MADGARPEQRQWPLRGFWLGWFRFSFLVFVVLVAGGSVLVVVAAMGSGPGLVAALVPGVILLAVGAVIGWQLLHTAVAVTLAPDGTLTLRRPRGALHTTAARVLRVRPSVLRSSYTPTVISTADGSAVLIHTRSEVDELVAALRGHQPDLVVEPHYRGGTNSPPRSAGTV